MACHRSVRLLSALLLPAFACGDDGRPMDSDPTATMTVPSLGSATDAATTGASGQPTTSTDPGGTDGQTDGATSNATPIDTSADTSASDTPATPATNPDTDSDSAGTTMGVSDTTPDTTGETGETGDEPCPDGTIVCDGDTKQVCDGMGGFKDAEVCLNACTPGVGCTLCVPGATECQGDTVLQCNQMGDAQTPIDNCDPLQGLTCDPMVGACLGACAGLGPSYIGCDYYPVTLQQFDGYNQAPQYEFAVAVSNTSAQVASVTITRGPNMVAQQQVQPNSVQVITLPWVAELSSGYGGSVVVADGAYRLRSNQPVTVYQYNPITVTFTNDASVLLPVNTWTGNYLVAAWPTWNFANMAVPGLYAVTARFDNTTVTLTPSATGKIVKAGGGVAANGTGVVVLGEGDVLEVLSDYNGDLTGTIIAADKPVQVMGGHKCTNVPLNVTACDHLEESMFPLETLAKEYVIAPPVQVPNDQAEKGQIVRIIASEAATTLTFTPDQPGNKFLANAGDFLEIPSSIAKFVVSADKKILVSQYMVGQDGGYGTSDPAMLVTVNPLQWRKNYLFHAPLNWQANYVDILAPLGAVVTVDAAPVAAWSPIGASNYQVAHVKLANNANGNHSVTGDVGVGISVYGVLSYGSYWYPGGLDLDTIPQ